MRFALAMDRLTPPDRTQSSFGVFREIERPRFVFDDRRARIHLRQFGAGEIRNVIRRLAESLADKLFQIVAHNKSCLDINYQCMVCGLRLSAHPLNTPRSEHRLFGPNLWTDEDRNTDYSAKPLDHMKMGTPIIRLNPWNTR